jgi:prepilin-type processing-associated H-X9-DG protein
VELLVVIGIIGLLISILLPSLSAARRQAAAVKCAAALRDIGNAFQMYSIDNKGYYPVVECANYQVGTMAAPGTAYWWDFIGKYVTKTKLGTSSSKVSESNEQRKSVIWGCPAWDGYISGSIITVNRIMPGYSMNWEPTMTASYPALDGNTKSTDKACTTSLAGNPPGKFFKQVQWTRPSERMLLTDGKFRFIEQLVLKSANPHPYPVQESNMGVTYSTPNKPGQNGGDIYRHGKIPGLAPGVTYFKDSGGKVAYNILYCDGHVNTSVDATEIYRSIRMRFPG